MWLNRSGAIVIAILLANQIRSARAASRWLKIVQLATLLLMAAIQVALFSLHPKLDQLLTFSNRAIIERNAFRSLHLLYINLSTIQWSAALAHLAAMLLAWRQSDSFVGAGIKTLAQRRP